MDCNTSGFLPCPSLSPRVCSNPCPLSWWCHPTISSSVSLFYTSYAGNPWLSKNHPHLEQHLLLTFPTPPPRPEQGDRKVYEIVSVAKAEVVSGEVGKEGFFFFFWFDTIEQIKLLHSRFNIGSGLQGQVLTLPLTSGRAWPQHYLHNWVK